MRFEGVNKMKLKNFLSIMFIAILFFPGDGGAAADGSVPSLLSNVRLEQNLNFCGESVPLADPEVRERMEKELLLSLWDRDQAILWFKRSRRYLPLIEKQLSRAGLPDDLKYVAIAESALRPHAGSAKGAIGFWQFMPDTARKYGLVVNERIDQRRNLAASTAAAMVYLADLHQEFGSWSLAVTAFNMGEEGLRAEILAQETDDFYRLYLSLESQRYLFRILAVKLMFSDPESFGFELRPEDYYPPLKFKTVNLTLFDEASLAVVAKAAGTDFKRIKDLNPELRGHYLAAGTHVIAIPVSAPDDFPERFAALHKTWQQQRSERSYVVQPGDNLSTIAARFDVPLAALLIWNRIGMNETLHPGDRLVIYRTGEDAADSGSAD